MIGYAMCASYCTLEKSVAAMEMLVSKGYELLPIVSENVYNTDTRFGDKDYWRKRIIEICKKGPLHSITETEKIGPVVKLDALVVAPCTGNTLAKCAQGITDTCVTMAVKAQLRNLRPVVIALSSNDALSANLKNIGTMLERKNVYFTPMFQDDIDKKPHSLIPAFDILPDTLEHALKGMQVQPLIREKDLCNS